MWDVKRSSKIRTSNKTFRFGLVFRPFDIQLLRAFCRMPLFVFDHDCTITWTAARHMKSGWWCWDVLQLVK